MLTVMIKNGVLGPDVVSKRLYVQEAHMPHSPTLFPSTLFTSEARCDFIKIVYDPM